MKKKEKKPLLYGREQIEAETLLAVSYRDTHVCVYIYICKLGSLHS